MEAGSGQVVHYRTIEVWVSGAMTQYYDDEAIL